jgi:hypothetical protein
VIPLCWRESRRGRSMMGHLKSDQGRLFYEFRLGDGVPEDPGAEDRRHSRPVLASQRICTHYSSMGGPSIDPELMVRILVVGYVFAIRSERLICREVQVNLAYRWFCKLRIGRYSRIIRHFRAPATSAFARETFSVECSNGSSRRALRPAWLVAKLCGRCELNAADANKQRSIAGQD